MVVHLQQRMRLFSCQDQRLEIELARAIARMADDMTYDGNMLFGHDRRNYIPLKIDLSARGQWLPKDYNHRDSRDKRYYAHEVQVPDDYMIVDAESFTPSSVYEEVRMIRVNPRQVAIPMTWFFKMKDMTIYEQWDFLRVYRLDIPYKLKTKICLDEALSKAYDLGIETDFLIHSVAWYISMITDDYISLDEELQELERQKEFEADLYSFDS